MKIIQQVFTGGTGVMPHTDPEMEAAVLGAILIETATARRVIPTLPSDYFYQAENRLIYEACCDLYRRGKGIDILTVAEWLRAAGTLEAVGGPYHVTVLAAGVASSAHIDYHIAILAGYHLRRRLREIALTCDGNASDMSLDPYDILVSTAREIQELAHYLPAVNELREMPPVVENVLALLDRRMSGDGGLTGVETGFPPLDTLFLGWQKKTLNIIAGRTGEGKTAVLIHSLLTAAEKGAKVCLVSLESDAEKLVERMILMRTDIDPDRWRRGTLTPEERAKAEEAGALLGRVSIRMYDRGNISMEKVCMMVKALHAEEKCDILGVDYLQLFRDSSRNVKREEEVAGNSRLLKQLSLQLDIPVIALCQFNREVVQNDKQVPQKENIRESGAIEQDADTITLIYHPAAAGLTVEPGSKYPVTEDMMVLMVAKNRNGATDNGYISHNRSFTKFVEYEPPADYLTRLAATQEKERKKNWRESKTYREYKQGREEKDGGLPF